MERRSVGLLMKAKRGLDKQANMPWTEYHPFRSRDARAEYFASLEEREKRWPIPSDNRVIETSWAKTFVRIGGPPDAPPLVLMHGAATNSVSWEANVKALSEEHRTYAIDNPYDIGRSVYHRDVKNIDEYAAWMDETFSALGLGDKLNIVGMSYGAWLTAEYALRYPQRLAKAVLISPALTVQNVRPIWVARCLLSMLNRSLSRNFAQWTLKDAYSKGSYYKQLVEEVGNDALMMSQKCISRHVVIPTKLKDEEWASITVPMLVLVGENEKIYHPRRAIEHMRRVAPNVKVEVIAGAGHDLPVAQLEIVNQKVLDFLKQ
jgi:pimeloyl-ACP methyl ester carboxylesterase